MGVRSDQHLLLVGLMGSGKTTVGRICAERLHRPFLDSDAALEAAVGRTVREIFATDGEEVFREIESAVLADLVAAPDPAVIAGAGGVVVRPENRVLLRGGRCRVVWLCTDPSVLVDRVRGAGHRPLLDADPMAKLLEMQAARTDLYREVAHAIVSTDGRSVFEVVEAVLR